MMLEECNKFLDLEGFWLLDIDEEPFVASADLRASIKLAVDASSDESAESLD